MSAEINYEENLYALFDLPEDSYALDQKQLRGNRLSVQRRH